MAWLYMILVLAVFYAPVIGIAPKLLEANFSIPGLGISIPFSGTLRPAIYSLVAWYLLWKLTCMVEEHLEFDLFDWLDQRMTKMGLYLRTRWLYAKRPFLSLRLAKYLARLALAISLTKLLGVVLLGLALIFVLPWLIDLALPGLAHYLLGNFAGVGWLERIAGWIGQDLISWIAGTLSAWIEDWIIGLLRLDIHANLPALSLLVLLAGRAYERERRERYRKDVRKHLRGQKKKQLDIKVLYD